MIEKPDKIVAESIHKKLKEANLLKDRYLSDIVDKLSSGNISEEDWKLMAELSIESNEGVSNVKKD
ncbi:hypothetical protein SCALIN_C31_0009 [Candidatus Scalindua japonica]|uniref:Uncharacterized protein n=1 Tax=Candidatus Scalindua japonica TaxID=1284222 RepID=A0A286U2M6_9BACT|nr:hypothetical protein [Candidatus Scalindua japonica]GAX62375.1 hypothetical protein SCALIN_C31_0009 [Candidatus Scalindua japonica]